MLSKIKNLRSFNKNILSVVIGICFGMFGFSQTGPGGVGTNDGTSDLVMWYRTDNALITSGSNVTNWINSAGYGVHDMAQSGSSNPQLIQNSVNGYDEIQFNTSGILQTGLNLTTSNFVTNQASSYIYTKVNSITRSFPYTTLPAGGQRFMCHIPWSNGIVYFDIGQCCGAAARIQVGGLSGLTNYSLWSYDANPISGKQLYRNGALLQDRANSSTYSSHSSHRFGLGSNFNGNITEVIVFKEKVNTAQRLIIENYLTAKYGNVLVDNDIYVQDDPVNGDFDHDVAGIGQASDGTNQTDSQGTGIVRVFGASDLDNNEFLIWGHNNRDLLVNNTTDIPPNRIHARLERVWRVSESNDSGIFIDVGTVDMVIDTSGIPDFEPSRPPQLLIDTDNDGFFHDESSLIGRSLGNNLYRFDMVTTIEDNVRFTFAIGTITIITNRRITHRVNKN
ncbi:hypothetical protein [Aquimarina sp. 2201CG14-23]|uniref:hypothetical protein n=1 Tax=Aquimarina mycalae TaxID=3040073 RepID=UPI00247810B8|nr:hypothetical protein [Aquimarina sp. 2201CG14-23]MDH7448398.1 hypothetical protein [Aquimarina sp. 2201CG14-23]